ncbi:MAG: hypothetical protein ABI873_04190 [Marmoricola sp.]
MEFHDGLPSEASAEGFDSSDPAVDNADLAGLHAAVAQDTPSTQHEVERAVVAAGGLAQACCWTTLVLRTAMYAPVLADLLADALGVIHISATGALADLIGLKPLLAPIRTHLAISMGLTWLSTTRSTTLPS